MEIGVVILIVFGITFGVVGVVVFIAWVSDRISQIKTNERSIAGMLDYLGLEVGTEAINTVVRKAPEESSNE